jgi:hypothetical protein
MMHVILLLCVIGNTTTVRAFGTAGVEITFSIDSVRSTDYAFPDAVWLNREGEPNLPSIVYTIGIPQDSDVDVVVTKQQEEIIRDVSIEPVYYPGIHESPERVTTPQYADVYKENALFPGDIVTVSRPGDCRDIRTVDVRLNPLRYNPVTKQLRITTAITLNVTFTTRPITRQITDTSFEEIFKRTLVNYEQCKTWRREPTPARGRSFSGVWYKIEVDEEGMYRIGYNDITRVGLDPRQFDPQTMKIYTAAFDLLPLDVAAPFEDSLIEIPVYVHGEDDHSFDVDDYLIFYAYPASHFTTTEGIGWYENGYTHNNVYWFTFGEANGKRMELVDAMWDGTALDTTVTEILHVEKDLRNPTRSGTNWYWLDISPGTGSLGSGSITLPHVRAYGSAEITVGIFTLHAGDFWYQFSTNGEVYFSDTLSLPVRDYYPPHYITGTADLNGDSSTLTLEIIRPASTSGQLTAFFNSVDMKYQRITDINRPFHALFPETESYTLRFRNVNAPPFVLDITNPIEPKMLYNLTIDNDVMVLSSASDSFQLLYITKLSLAESAALVPVPLGNLRTQSSGCEYLIITHRDFRNAILPLADFRRQEYATRVVVLDDIFDDFSFGKFDPLAIKHFLYYTTNNWTVVPTFVLLVGDATYDYKNNLQKTNPPNYVPMYESGTKLTGDAVFIQNTVYEGEYVDFGAGEAMVLGRITARTKQEVRDFIDKVITYETSPIDGVWNKRLILAGDDEYGNPRSYNPWEGPDMHCGACENVIAYVPDSLYDFAKVYMVSYPPFVYPTYKPNAESAFVNALNRGGLAGIFIGHGNTHQLAHEGLFYDSDIARIRNGRRYFFYYFGSCTVGRFSDSDYECISEELVRMQNGAIGTMAATKGTSSPGNNAMARELCHLITALDTNLTFGECVRLSKRFGSKEYLLIGDPASRPRKATQTMAVSALPDSLRPLEKLNVTTDANRYYLRAFIRDTTHIEKFDASTIDKISGHVYRAVQSGPNPGDTVQFDYNIDGKEIYTGYWDRDTATIIVPRVATTHDPIVKLTTFTGTTSGLLDSILVYGTASPSSDDVGPEITLYEGGRVLNDGDWVPSDFTLTGKVLDESGINVLNSIDDAVRGFYLYINQDLENKIDLRDYFQYDRNSYTSGEFHVNLTLPYPTDTLTINVADNHYNQTITRIILQAELYGGITIDNALMYPNPVHDNQGMWFTYSLSTPGTVDIKIFTVAGRLIQTIDNIYSHAGYNQVFWDGLDAYKDEISNGVYLVKIYARAENAHDEVVEKFIVAR